MATKTTTKKPVTPKTFVERYVARMSKEAAADALYDDSFGLESFHKAYVKKFKKWPADRYVAQFQNLLDDAGSHTIFCGCPDCRG